MDEVKDKVKDFMKKINNPFTSSSSKFKGQGRVLGSSSSADQKSPNPIQNDGRRHRQMEAPSLDNKGDNPQRNRGTVIEPLDKKLSESLSLVGTQSKSSEVLASNHKPDGFDPFNSNISSRRGPKSGASINMFQCPVCNKWFKSEEEVSGHIENCLENNPKEFVEGGAIEGDSSEAGDKIEANKELANHVGTFLSGNPSKGTLEVILKLLRNVVNDPSNEKFRRIRMSNPKIQDTLGMALGGVELLECIGFKFQAEGEDMWGVMPIPSDEKVSVIVEAIALLEPHILVSSSSSSNGQANSTERRKIDRQFVGSALKERCLEFELWQPAVPKSRVIPRSAKPGERMPTLEDEDLVPAALVKFKPIETDSIVFTGLCNDLLAVSESLTSAAFPSRQE